MPTRRSPEERARGQSKELTSIRRKYKVNTRTRKRFLQGEEGAVATTVAVLKIAGFSNVQVSRVVGISRGQVAEILDKPEVQEELVSLRRNLTGAAIDLLQSYTIEAIQALINVLRTTPDDKIVIQAAAEILDRAGIPKVSRSEKSVETEERTTFTDDGIVDALRQLPPDKQEEAAQMIEGLEAFLTEHAGVIEEEAEE